MKFTKLMLLSTILAVVSLQSTHAMLQGLFQPSPPISETAKAKNEIQKAIDLAKTLAPHCSVLARDYEGSINDINWKVFATKDTNSPLQITVTCSDKEVENFFKQ